MKEWIVHPEHNYMGLTYRYSMREWHLGWYYVQQRLGDSYSWASKLVII